MTNDGSGPATERLIFLTSVVPRSPSSVRSDMFIGTRARETRPSSVGAAWNNRGRENLRKPMRRHAAPMELGGALGARFAINMALLTELGATNATNAITAPTDDSGSAPPGLHWC